MVRKSQRVIGTLIVWIAILFIVTLTLDRLTYPRTNMRNAWYHSNVVTGATTEEATQIIDSLQSVNSELAAQVSQFAQAEMLTYLPYILLIVGVVLAGGVLSTLLIWRSVIVPDAISDMITTRHQQATASETAMEDNTLAHLLADDGELSATEAPAYNHRQELS